MSSPNLTLHSEGEVRVQPPDTHFLPAALCPPSVLPSSFASPVLEGQWEASQPWDSAPQLPCSACLWGGKHSRGF